MKNELMPEPDKMTLDKISQYFNTDETAREYLESRPLAGRRGLPALQKRRRKIHLENQGQQRRRKSAKDFTAARNATRNLPSPSAQSLKIRISRSANGSSRSISTHASKKGISSLQLQRILGLGSYRTALFMATSHPPLVERSQL